MSAAVLEGKDAPRPVHPSWLRMVGAVIGGSIVAFALTFAWLIPLGVLGAFPLVLSGEPSGHGWPWRIEGPWSFAADLGPLLLCGAALAVGVETVTSRWTDVRARRAPLVFAAASVGWVTVASPPNSGLVSVGGLVGFIALVVVARECSVRERRPRRPWTMTRVTLTLVGVLLLAAASISYGLLHPLTAGNGGNSTAEITAGRAEFSVILRNEGRLEVRVLGLDVPNSTITRVRTDNEAVTSAPTIDGLMKPLAGSTIDGHNSRFAELTIAPATCNTVIDRVGVRLNVAGRQVQQVVRFDSPVRLTCA
jgi:multisubunit Na+/H+ antiporter MnhE subunit